MKIFYLTMILILTPMACSHFNEGKVVGTSEKMSIKKTIGDKGGSITIPDSVTVRFSPETFHKNAAVTVLVDKTPVIQSRLESESPYGQKIKIIKVDRIIKVFIPRYPESWASNEGGDLKVEIPLHENLKPYLNTHTHSVNAFVSQNHGYAEVPVLVSTGLVAGNLLTLTLDGTNFSSEKKTGMYQAEIILYVGENEPSPVVEDPYKEVAISCEAGDLNKCLELSYNREGVEKKVLLTKICNGNLIYGCVYLANVEKQNGNIDEARRLLKKVCELGKNRYCINLGAFEEDQKNFVEARKIFQSICDKGDMHGCGLVARRDYRDGNLEGADKYWTMTCATGVSCELLSMVKKKRGDLEGALKISTQECSNGKQQGCYEAELLKKRIVEKARGYH